MGDYQANHESEAVMEQFSQGVQGVMERARAFAASAPRESWVLLACGVLIAASAWLLLGWERADARETLHLWKTAAYTEAKLLMRALQNMGHACAQALGLKDDPSGSVSAGDVSEMIDIVRLGLTAGLSFDAALGQYCSGRSGILARRLARARLSWQTGLCSRADGLIGVARDLDVRSLESFALAVGQALELGAPLADTLAEQGKEIRAAHRADVERQIERAPVKLLIPTGTLILPALLLSIVGPLLAAGGMI